MGRGSAPLIAALLAGAACLAAPGEEEAPPAGVRRDRPAALIARVLARHPHDPEAFTQGLLWHGGFLYESTGLYGASTLRRVDPESGEVLQRIDLPPQLFGEGLARVGERLVQLTWRAGRALLYDLPGLEPEGELRYQGQGWGLCFDGARIVMSDGTETLSLRDQDTFAEVGRLRVTLGGRPLTELNELECAEGWIYANLWGRDRIVRIDPGSGEVGATIDASALLTPAERAAADVLNGIAYHPERETFFLTGKRWPWTFEVVFEPGPAGDPLSSPEPRS